MAQVGKRYKCETSGIEVLVTKGGEGELYCLPTDSGDGPIEMTLVQPKQTASAD